MSVKKYMNLWPRKKTWGEKIVECLVMNLDLIVFGGLAVAFLLFVMMCQIHAQADYLMVYGSGS